MPWHCHLLPPRCVNDINTDALVNYRSPIPCSSPPAMKGAWGYGGDVLLQVDRFGTEYNTSWRVVFSFCYRSKKNGHLSHFRVFSNHPTINQYLRTVCCLILSVIKVPNYDLYVIETANIFFTLHHFQINTLDLISSMQAARNVNDMLNVACHVAYMPFFIHDWTTFPPYFFHEGHMIFVVLYLICSEALWLIQ